ncbi:MAG: RtcB family protein [Bacteroidetes bacterium]|nr:RtcB family protein [Bacteroidota bacterium]
MAKLSIRGKDLRDIGYPEGPVISVAMRVMEKNYKHSTLEEALEILKKIVANPAEFMEDAPLNQIADLLVEKPKAEGEEIPLLETGIAFSAFGQEHIEQGAFDQMKIAARLPIARAAALMPDAHSGYGLPIGGVLATENAVIPYGVGVDIGCRMCLSVFDIPAGDLLHREKFYQRELIEGTLFGAGREFKETPEHEILDRKEFGEIALLKNLHMKAAKQLGSSGSGNHFVEWGVVEISDPDNALKVPPGQYVALLSHSGSRGLGATIAGHYTRVAKEKTRLPREAGHLAWLNLDTQEGMEYWIAMNLAGDYASACHHEIHRKLARVLNVAPIAMVENHHNFAWKEMVDGREMIVHRKGATPAAKGVMGIIPGSMTAPGFIVSGKGEAAALHSASHGAGRKMSRTKAMNSVTHAALKEVLKANGVKLLGGGLDEAPHAYKDIHAVMGAQTNLVNVEGIFYPKIVKMDG